LTFGRQYLRAFTGLDIRRKHPYRVTTDVHSGVSRHIFMVYLEACIAFCF
jgi:hypothetical protein